MLPEPKLTFEAVKGAAAGRWPDILAGLGIDPAALHNRHQPCPGCGGRDRFRFDDQDTGRFYCGGGGEPVSGDGFKLLQHVHGWAVRESLERVAEAIGMGGEGGKGFIQMPPPRPRTAPRVASKWTHYARRLWRNADVDDAVVGAHPYAITKGIDWAAGAGRVTASGSVVGDNADCVVIPIRTPDDKLLAVQCINANGDKQTFGTMGDDGCLLLGNTLDRSIPWVVVEGWADAVSVVFHIRKGNAVAAVAFGMKRMEKVAQAVADRFQPEVITILRDAA